MILYDSPAHAKLKVSAFVTALSGVAAAPSAGAVLSLALSPSPQERRSAQKVAAGAAKRANRRRRSGEARRKSPQERRSAQTVAAGAAKRAKSAAVGGKRAYIVAVNLLAYHHGCTTRAVGFKKP